jgi:hypothetical protein
VGATVLPTRVRRPRRAIAPVPVTHDTRAASSDPGALAARIVAEAGADGRAALLAALRERS